MSQCRQAVATLLSTDWDAHSRLFKENVRTFGRGADEPRRRRHSQLGVRITHVSPSGAARRRRRVTWRARWGRQLLLLRLLKLPRDACPAEALAPPRGRPGLGERAREAPICCLRHHLQEELRQRPWFAPQPKLHALEVHVNNVYSIMVRHPRHAEERRRRLAEGVGKTRETEPTARETMTRTDNENDAIDNAGMWSRHS